MLPALSILNSTRPALTSLTARAVSSVTVPVLGLGMRPRGPRTLPSLRTSPMASGVATATSNSAQPSWHFFIRSSKPTYSAPAARAASAEGPFLAKTSTRTVLPLPCGSGTVPRTIWSDCFGSTPSRKARSTVSLNLALGNLARTSTADFSGYVFLPSTSSSAFLKRLLGISFGCGANEREALPRFFVLTHYFDTHTAGRAGNDAKAGLFGGGVQIFHFDFDNIEHLFAGDLANFFLVGLFGPGGDSSSFLEQGGSRWRFGDECERFVLIDGDDDRNNHSGLIFGGRVEFLAEGHDVDAMLTESRPDGRSRVGLTGRDLQFNLSYNFLCHNNFYFSS